MIPNHERHATDTKILRSKVITSPFKYEHQLLKDIHLNLQLSCFTRATLVGQESAGCIYLVMVNVSLEQLSRRPARIQINVCVS